MTLKVANNRPSHWNEIDLIAQIKRVIEGYNSIVHPDNSGNHIKYSAAYPDYIFDNTDQATVVDGPHKLICYDIVKKTDASIGESVNSNKTKPRPRLMERRDVVINEGKEDEKTVVEEVYAKRYDLILRFDCLAPSDYESMSLIRDFERMMEIHAQYLESGIIRFLYRGRRPSYFNRDTQYKSRTCEFFATVEEQWFSQEDKIEKINIEYLHQMTIT